MLAGFAERGVAAHAFRCDVADEDQLSGVLDTVRRSIGPVRGVIHAAMVLDDARLADLDVVRFDAVLRPKVFGALVLDRLTRADRLDHFILFSSISTILGTPGQAGYVAANAAIEALVERRRAEGLPGVAVMWGPIGDCGYLAREMRVSDMLSKMMGASHMQAAQALEELPALLRSGRAVVGLGNVNWGHVRQQLPNLGAPFWSELPVVATGDHSARSIRAQISERSPAEATEVILQVLIEEIAAILKQPQASIEPDRSIVEFGVDSLMAVELQMALEHRLGVKQQLFALAMTSTLRKIAIRMQQTMREDEVGASHTLPVEVDATLLRHEGVPAGVNVVAYRPPATVRIPDVYDAGLRSAARGG